MSEHQILEALRAVHDERTEASERAIASSYLASFQRSLLSWNVSLNLLSRTDVSVVASVFAAQTLTEKLRTQSWQLSADSWAPVRTCILSLLQQPTLDALLLKQASLCMVSFMIICNATDEASLRHLQSLLPTERLLLVLRMLAEELASDGRQYLPAPGVTSFVRLSGWLQTQKAALVMAPLVFAWLRDITSAAEAQATDALVASVLDCSAVWYHLGVLVSMRPEEYWPLIEYATRLCADVNGSAPTVIAAARAITQAMERCPDALIAQLAGPMGRVAAVALEHLAQRDAPRRCERISALVSLYAAYVQACADSIAAGAAGEAVRPLFALVAAVLPSRSGALPASGTANDGESAIDEDDGVVGRMNVSSGSGGGGGMWDVADRIGLIAVPLLEAISAVAVATQVLTRSAAQQGMCDILVRGLLSLLPQLQVVLEVRAADDKDATVLVALSTFLESWRVAHALVTWPTLCAGIISSMRDEENRAGAPPPPLAAALVAISQIPNDGDDDSSDDSNAEDDGGADSGDMEVAMEDGASSPRGRNRQRELSDGEVAAVRDWNALLLMLLEAKAGSSSGPDAVPPVLANAILGCVKVLAPLLPAVWSASDDGGVDAAVKLTLRVLDMLTAAPSSMTQRVAVEAARSMLVALSRHASPSTVTVLAQALTQASDALARGAVAPHTDAPLLEGVLQPVLGSCPAIVSTDGRVRDVLVKLTDCIMSDLDTSMGAIAAATSTHGDADVAMQRDNTATDALAATLEGGQRCLQRVEVVVGRLCCAHATTQLAGALRERVVARVERVWPALLNAVESPGLTAAPRSALSRTAASLLRHLLRHYNDAVRGAVIATLSMIVNCSRVEAVSDWHRLVAAALIKFLPKESGDTVIAEALIAVIQHFWTLPALQALPCPGEADIIPDVSIATSTLCTHLARALPTASIHGYAIASLIPLLEAGMVRSAMAAGAHRKPVAAAALSSLNAVLSAASQMPSLSLALMAGCLLRCGGTVMIGFTSALAAPNATQRVHKLTQLLVHLSALIAIAVPLVVTANGGAFVGMANMQSLTYGAAPPAIGPAELAQGVALVMGWLKHALQCLRSEVRKKLTPEGVVAALQPLLTTALDVARSSAAAQTPLAALGVLPGGGAPGALPQLGQGNARFVSALAGVPPGAPASQGPGVMWHSLGAGAPFSGALRAEQSFAGQLSALQISGATSCTDRAQSSTAPPPPLDVDAALASKPFRALKKAVRSVADALASAVSASESGLESRLPPFNFSAPLPTPQPLQQQQQQQQTLFQPAVYLTGSTAAPHLNPYEPGNHAPMFLTSMFHQASHQGLPVPMHHHATVQVSAPSPPPSTASGRVTPPLAHSSSGLAPGAYIQYSSPVAHVAPFGMVSPSLGSPVIYSGPTAGAGLAPHNGLAAMPNVLSPGPAATNMTSLARDLSDMGAAMVDNTLSPGSMHPATFGGGALAGLHQHSAPYAVPPAVSMTLAPGLNHGLSHAQACGTMGALGGLQLGGVGKPPTMASGISTPPPMMQQPGIHTGFQAGMPQPPAVQAAMQGGMHSGMQNALPGGLHIALQGALQLDPRDGLQQSGLQNGLQTNGNSGSQQAFPLPPRAFSR